MRKTLATVRWTGVAVLALGIAGVTEIIPRRRPADSGGDRSPQESRGEG